MAVTMGNEKDHGVMNVEAGIDSPTQEYGRPPQDDVRVTPKTWFVVAILSFGYGLSFIVSSIHRIVRPVLTSCSPCLSWQQSEQR